MGSPRCLRLHISYLGTNFSGFQEQSNARTVEGELKKALAKISGQMVKIRVAGRTDAGVHAHGQVVSVTLFIRLSERQLTLALRSHLPKDMAVFRIDSMPLSFDARRQSVGKQYIYRIGQGLAANPFLAPTVHHVPKRLDHVAMMRAALHFVGEHDFSSFRSAACTSAHARRYIWHAGVADRKGVLEVDIRGNAFCLNMVRIMVGTLIEIGQGRRAPETIHKALLAQDRRDAGFTAKPEGLTLNRVYYPDDLKGAFIPEGAVFPRYPVSQDSWGFSPAEITRGPEY